MPSGDQLRVFAAMLMVVGMGGIAATLGFWCSAHMRVVTKMWLCHCGMKNALGVVTCVQCGRWRGQKS